MRNFWYVRIFEPVIRALAARGHTVHILAEQGEGKALARDWNDAAARLAAEYPNITFAWAPTRIDDEWIDLRIMIRLGLDHMRFLRPEYADAPKLGARARSRTPRLVVRLADAPLLGTPLGRRLVSVVLRAMERATPIDPDVRGYVESHPSDVVLVTPLLTLGSEQQDIVRIARARGVPTILCVGSWDHLSSKALIREAPDRADRVVVTGAQCFDEWFDRRPTLDREAFCRKVGLDPARPYVLYVCSALFEGSPSEAAFVRRWVTAVRESTDPRLRDAGILVRPHPKRGFEWDDVTLGDVANTALWPPRGAAPFDAGTKADYFDSMYHGAVTVGLNTSALIEAGIVGRAVHTILLPEFYENQEGTLHFRYLLDGGLLRSARDLDAHVVQLADSLARADAAVHHNTAFVERFVRPRGRATAATPVFAEAGERAVRPLARRPAGTFAQQISRKRRRRDKERTKVERVRALEAQRVAEKQRLADERRARRDAVVAAREATTAGARAEQRAARQQEIEEKQRRKEARMEQWQREKRRRALNARLAAYWRRVVKPFSAPR